MTSLGLTGKKLENLKIERALRSYPQDIVAI
jgi:hypothetical protein